VKNQERRQAVAPIFRSAGVARLKVEVCSLFRTARSQLPAPVTCTVWAFLKPAAAAGKKWDVRFDAARCSAVHTDPLTEPSCCSTLSLFRNTIQKATARKLFARAAPSITKVRHCDLLTTTIAIDTWPQRAHNILSPVRNQLANGWASFRPTCKTLLVLSRYRPLSDILQPTGSHTLFGHLTARIMQCGR